MNECCELLGAIFIGQESSAAVEESCDYPAGFSLGITVKITWCISSTRPEDFWHITDEIPPTAGGIIAIPGIWDLAFVVKVLGCTPPVGGGISSDKGYISSDKGYINKRETSA